MFEFVKTEQRSKKVWQVRNKMRTFASRYQRKDLGTGTQRTNGDCDKRYYFFCFTLNKFCAMFQIASNFSITRLNNAELVAFFINFRKAVNTSTPESLGIEGQMSAFNTKLDELVDRVYVTTASEYTAAMRAADEKRCLIFRRIRLRLQMVEVADPNSPLVALQDMVRAHLLSKYVSTVVSRAYQERTSILQGFIYDLNNKLSEDDVENLHLGEDIIALEMANNEFVSAYAQRTAEKAEGNKGVTARLRNEMNDIYLQMIFIIQYLANSTVEANATKALACQNFIAVVNVLLSDAKNRLDQRLKAEATEGNGSSEGDGSDNEGDEGDGSGASEGGSSDGGNGSSGSSEGGNGNSGGSGSSDGGSGDNGNSGSSDGEYDPNKPNENGTISDGEITF